MHMLKLCGSYIQTVGLDRIIVIFRLYIMTSKVCKPKRASVVVHENYGSQSQPPQPLVLYGHRSIVSALALSTSSGSPHPSPTTLLCSAADDRLLLWNLDSCYEQRITGTCKLAYASSGVLYMYVYLGVPICLHMLCTLYPSPSYKVLHVLECNSVVRPALYTVVMVLLKRVAKFIVMLLPPRWQLSVSGA